MHCYKSYRGVFPNLVIQGIYTCTCTSTALNPISEPPPSEPIYYSCKTGVTTSAPSVAVSGTLCLLLQPRILALLARLGRLQQIRVVTTWSGLYSPSEIIKSRRPFFPLFITVTCGGRSIFSQNISFLAHQVLE